VAIAGESHLTARRRLPAALGRTPPAELVALGALLAAQAALFSRGLEAPPDFDEAAYLAETDAWRHGQELGSEVFVAQPPVFYTLLRAGQWAFGNSVDGGRLTIVVLALVGVIAAWALARRLAGPAAGLVAAALLGVTPVYATFASKISADLPALALVLVGLTLFASGRARGTAVAAGVVLAVAVAVKLSAVTAAVPLLALALTADRYRVQRLAWGLGGALAAGALMLLAFADDLPGLWEGVVAYHGAARDAPGPSYVDNVERVLRFLDPRTPFAWLVVAGAAATLVPRPRLRALLPLWLWALASALFLVWHRPLHDNHMVLLGLTLALPAGAALGARTRALRPRLRAALALGIAGFVVAGFVQETRRLDRNAGPVAEELRAAAAYVRAETSPDELVVSDQPLVPYLAGRRSPGRVIDAAVLRFDSGYLDDDDVLEAADGAAAVVVARAFRVRPQLLAELSDRFPRRRSFDGVTVYLR
jgi:4-amino-4-deoxy-L-arabinose transferase-like glycosyltransferase